MLRIVALNEILFYLAQYSRHSFAAHVVSYLNKSQIVSWGNNYDTNEIKTKTRIKYHNQRKMTVSKISWSSSATNQYLATIIGEKNILNIISVSFTFPLLTSRLSISIRQTWLFFPMHLNSSLNSLSDSFFDVLLLQHIFTKTANLTNILYGYSSGWSSSSLLVLESNDTSPLIQGELNQEERSWVTSLFAISGVAGTVIYYLIANSAGRKIPLWSVGIPHIVSDWYNVRTFAGLKEQFNVLFIFFYFFFKKSLDQLGVNRDRRLSMATLFGESFIGNGVRRLIHIGAIICCWDIRITVSQILHRQKASTCYRFLRVDLFRSKFVV